MDWNDVAEEIGISPESLRAIRKGRNGPKEVTARAIDDWLSWAPGSTEAVFDGGDPMPIDTELPAAAPDVSWPVQLTVHVNPEEPEPAEPPGGFRSQGERIIWALTEYPWQLRWAQIKAGRDLEAATPSVEPRIADNRS